MKPMNRDERLISGLCHLAVFVPLWGILVPLIIWLLEVKEPSEFRRDTLQAMVYQTVQAVITGVIYVIAMVFYFVAAIPIAILSENSPSDSGMMILLMGIGLIVMFLLLICLLFLALFQTLGIVAAVKVWKGQSYRYPIIGKLLDRKNHAPVEFV